ncbi:hypothetical protein JWG40_10510 [Leptospira sp. 201903074]|uniref:hypothetical protein n=1 Tax=Leptospira abararensis TaxID=2810036 RepID=UPI001964EB29|nr:hypothetical protein [Leptospira abararensis]MBM9547449.1 hypothetical protein [Leptospira abararensis]
METLSLIADILGIAGFFMSAGTIYHLKKNNTNNVKAKQTVLGKNNQQTIKVSNND